MNAKFIEALTNFETKFHSDIQKWILTKSAFPFGDSPKPEKNLEILDISEDFSIFSQLLAAQWNAKRLVVAVRASKEDVKVTDANLVEIKEIALKDNYDLTALGKFDVIILKEMLHEVDSLSTFITSLKNNLKSPESQIFIFMHPKNPPLPLPDEATQAWRKLALSREYIMEELDKAGYKHDVNMNCYAVSCPIAMDKFDWEELLLAKCVPAIRNSPKCNDRAIANFIKMKYQPMKFEEKILLFRLWTD